MSRRRIATLTLAAGLATGAFSASLAGSASADTTVMGSTLASPFDGGVAGGATTVSTQISVAGSATNPYISPANGIITNWKVKSADDGAFYSLKILRLSGPLSITAATNSNFSGIATSPVSATVPIGTGAGTPTGLIFDNPASIPIAKGDYIGILTGGADDDLPQFNTNGVPANTIANNFGAQPVDGNTSPLLADVQHELLIQATVRYCKVPNLVGQAESAAATALTAADCAAGTVTKAKTSKASEVGKVISTTPAKDETAVPGTAVNLTVGVASCGKPKKKGKGKKGAAAAKKKKKGCGKKKKKKKK